MPFLVSFVGTHLGGKYKMAAGDDGKDMLCDVKAGYKHRELRKGSLCEFNRLRDVHQESGLLLGFSSTSLTSRVSSQSVGDASLTFGLMLLILRVNPRPTLPFRFLSYVEVCISLFARSMGNDIIHPKDGETLFLEGGCLRRILAI